MSDKALDMTSYYRLRIYYQQNINKLTTESMSMLLSSANNILIDKTYSDDFEKNRVIDFIDELELIITGGKL
jgi:molybdopterin/thiamine biosynthesis adenylyltransferase